MMKIVEDLPLKWKLVIIMLSISALTLLLSSSIFVYNDLKLFKKSMVRNLTVLAGAVGANSRAAIFFGDPEAANKILSSLKKEPQIKYASLYDAKGNIFVTYTRAGLQGFEGPVSKEVGPSFWENRVELIQPIELKGKIIGKIYLNAHLKEFEDVVKSYIVFLSIILFTTLIISLVLSLKLQGIISKPILLLAETAIKISKNADYSLRASRESADELGILYSEFNEMLSQIQKRDKELGNYRHRLEDLVKERTRELEDAQKELVKRERLAVLGKLAAMVSHEIRNPLGTIRNAAYSINHSIEKNHPELLPSLELIDRNIIRCDNIISELLEIARTREESMEITNIDSWLNQVINEQSIPQLVTVERALTSQASIPLVRERFRRAMNNVIQNACQALMEKHAQDMVLEENKKGYFLKIESVIKDSRLEIIFTDTGVGIQKDQLKKIFEPLYSTKNYGVGLGLPIVEGIMKQHGGGVDVKSNYQQGTTVILWFPLVKEKT